MSDTYVALADVDARWGHMDGWGAGWMWVWGIAMMLLLAVVIVLLVRGVAGAGRAQPQAPSDPTDRARGILAERYAKGELTTQEYRERVDGLG